MTENLQNIPATTEQEIIEIVARQHEYFKTNTRHLPENERVRDDWFLVIPVLMPRK
jgi:hypothetical protein